MDIGVRNPLRLKTLPGLCFHKRLAITLKHAASKLALALGVSFFLIATTLSAAPTYVTGGAKGCASVSSCSVSLTGTNAGDLIVLGLFVSDSTSVSSVTDSQGATFTLIGSPQTWGGSFVERLYYAKNIAAGSHTITVNLSGIPSYSLEVHTYDYSGLDTSSPLDVSATPKTGTGTSGTTNNVTTTNANDLLFAFFHSDNGVTNTAGSGFTGRTPTTDTYPLGEDKNVTSTNSYSATMSYSASADYVGFLVAFKAASGGGGGTPPSISTQPSNQTVTVGQQATFTVVATGTAPLTYQWQKNGTNISGATSSTYTTPATTSGDSGSTFRVTVNNSYGSVTSNSATLTVTSSGPTIYYYIEDSLGSSRSIVQDGQTSPCYDADFYPFGGEKPYTNTCPQNYKFEGKERDSETNNDYFGARYYSSTYGRWLSSDWSATPVPVPYANLTNPQTLNLYAMVSDDPETFGDLNGHDGCGSGGSSAGSPCSGVPTGLALATMYGAEIGVVGYEHQATSASTRKKPPLSLKQDIVTKGKGRGNCNQACQLRRQAAWVRLWADFLGLASILDEGETEEPALQLRLEAAELESEAAAAEAAEELARLSGMLRDAAAGKGNFGIGKATATEADELGKAWVGPGSRVASDGRSLVSGNELRVYRPPTFKPSQGRMQANFEQKVAPGGQPVSNAHLDIQ